MPGLTSRSFAVEAPPPSPVGDVIPHATPHAVSVSLPKWQDNVDYEEGSERIKKAMSSGYPRFYIHHQIDKLAQIIVAKFGYGSELCILLPSQATADSCASFLSSRSSPVSSRLVQYPIKSPSSQTTQRTIVIHACFFAAEDFGVAKQFWQHTGDGISSRVAERCLIWLGELGEDGAAVVQTPAPAQEVEAPIVGKGGRYAAKRQPSSSSAVANGGASGATSPILGSITSSKSRYSTVTTSAKPSPPSSLENSLDSLPPKPLGPIDQEEDVLARYVEERYGRNLDLSMAPLAKRAMRRRIAGVLREVPGQALPVRQAGGNCAPTTSEEESTRGVQGLTDEGVWLYPCGMSAIFHAHQLAMGARVKEGGKVGKSVCFGFPYTDTLKILEKWGPGCDFLGHGLTTDLPALRKLCEDAAEPLLAVFCEFPSNPLLRSPPLKELRALADEFGFLLVVDETIAGFVNIEVLPWVDIVVSSLTKVFSGDSNVMGGSLVINPKSAHYDALKATQVSVYEDNYFDEDAIYMERNSRDFIERIAQENSNATMICDLLRSRRAVGPTPPGMIPFNAPTDHKPSVIKDVYYPKFMTPEHYDACLRTPDPAVPQSSGYGALFSLTFTSALAAQVFFDALPCYKGPSLGTNFTLACPYTLLAHYTELDWAKNWGVEMGLVRVSVGLEEPELLRKWFLDALQMAEAAVKAKEA